MKFKTQWNVFTDKVDHETGEVTRIRKNQYKGEVNTMPSMTKPDQSMTILQIMERHAAGLPIDSVNQVPLYVEDDVMLPDLRYGDKVDHMQMLNDVREDIERMKKQLHEAAERQKALEAKEKAHQGPKVERTTGHADDQGEDNEPDPNILKKPGVQGQRPATKQKEAKK